MRVSRIAAAAGLGWLLVAGAAVAADSPTIDALDWLSGDWVSERDARWTEEHWTHPRGGAMLGLGRSGKEARMLGFELMRITTETDGSIIFWGAPGGRRPVPFKLVSQNGTEVAFENPQHGFPKRIAYKREGDRLTATVSGGDESAKSWTYERRHEAVSPGRRSKN
ncbi:DUF6265 family protein [Sphingoaurantiacus capsulatus]|uniref:DUF6265 family protein n=1 Tax=Sphingoaurantiacus capsulatus TaxID=1771310 RepID=A0ABV7XAA5_9SPHN